MSVGGRRRTTEVAQHRLLEFSKLVPRFQALRRLGVNSRQMVRAAGPPAILYGCEVMGVSDTSLHHMRTKVTAAAAPQAGGKAPDMVLYVLDGPWHARSCVRSPLQSSEVLGYGLVGKVVPSPDARAGFCRGQSQARRSQQLVVECHSRPYGSHAWIDETAGVDDAISQANYR